MSLEDKDVIRARGCVKTENLLELLGEGAYGAVYKIVEGNKYYALKTYDPSRALSTDNLIEIDILVRAKHPNVLGAHSVSLKECGICLTLPIASSDLDKWMRANPVDQRYIDRRVKIFYESMCGVRYLHLNHIIHRDIKPPNVLMFGDVPKIADFGLASLFPHDRVRNTGDVVTWPWRAPELLAGATTYTSAVDIWAMGIMFYQMLTGRELINGRASNPPKDEPYADDLLLEISKKIGPLTPEQQNIVPPAKRHLAGTEHTLLFSLVPERYVSLLMRMLERDPKRRASAEEVLTSPPFVIYGCQVSKMEVLPFPIAFSKVYAQTRQQLLTTVKSVIDRYGYGTETFFLAADILDRYATVKPAEASYLTHALVSVYLAAGVYSMPILGLRKELEAYVNDLREKGAVYLDVLGYTPEQKFSKVLCTAIQALNFRIFRPTIDLHFPGVDKHDLQECVINGQTPDSITDCAEEKTGKKRVAKGRSEAPKRRR